MADDGTIDGLTEDELIDDAELDTLVREAITQVSLTDLQAFRAVQASAGPPLTCLPSPAPV